MAFLTLLAQSWLWQNVFLIAETRLYEGGAQFVHAVLVSRGHQMWDLSPATWSSPGNCFAHDQLLSGTRKEAKYKIKSYLIDSLGTKSNLVTITTPNGAVLKATLVRPSATLGLFSCSIWKDFTFSCFTSSNCRIINFKTYEDVIYSTTLILINNNNLYM